MSIKNYSVFSTDAGLLKIEDILSQDFTKKTNKAVLTDYNTLMGVPSFIEKCNSLNVDPIIGVTITIGNSDVKDGNITLYAKNENGFKNLKLIVSSLSEDRNKHKYTDIANIINNSEDIIALTGGHGTISNNLLKNGDDALFLKHIYNLQKAFKDNLAFEIQVLPNVNNEEINSKIINVAKQLNLNVYATNDQKMKRENHYPLLIEKIKEKRGVSNKTNESISKEVISTQYIKSPEEMRSAFFPYIDTISNLSSFFKDIKPFNIFVDIPEIPLFPNINDSNHFMKILNEKYKAFIKTIPEEKRNIYLKRLKEEIEVIKELKFENYFVIFEQIEKNKVENQKFNLRGSSVSFLTTHILGLSDIDPVEHGLLSERFLNRNRLLRHELPDIDLESNDIESIAEYLLNVFGEKNTAYLSSSSNQTAKPQILLAERALKNDIIENPLDQNGEERIFPENDFKILKKFISSVYGSNVSSLKDIVENGYISKKAAAQNFNLGFDFNSQVFKKEYSKISNVKNLCNTYPNIKKIIGYIKTLDDVIISHGVSYGSIVVSNKPITDFFSTKYIMNDNKSIKIAIESSKKHVEKLGLVKLDILSNVYLNKLQVVHNITGVPWDYDNQQSEKYSNKNVYDMISSGLTYSLNQITSVSQQELSKKIKIENFNELVSLMALIRPAVSNDSIEQYLYNKNNKSSIVYEHPLMKSILEKTHGIIIFEEQIMEISQKIGGFSKEKSDDFRSLIKKAGASDKKDKNYFKLEEMKKEFLKGATEINRIEPDVALKIISKIDDLKGYTFSKAHSLSYASILYKQAYFDANYPAEYLQAYILKDKRNNKKSQSDLNNYLNKLIDMGRVILNADINRSLSDFKTRRKDSVVYIDPSLNYVIQDEKFTNLILKERKNGSFNDLYDFIDRTFHSFLNKSRFAGEFLEDIRTNKDINKYKENIFKLINSGAFDSFVPQELRQEMIHIQRNTLTNAVEQTIEIVTNPFSNDAVNYLVLDKNAKNEIALKETEIYSFSPSKYREDLTNKMNLINVNESKKKLYPRNKP